MTGPQLSDAVEREIYVEARPETVFAFFTEAEKLILWQGVDAEIDPRPGGVYRVNVTGRQVTRGEYVEIIPFSRIVFTWGWDHYLPRLSAVAAGRDPGADPWTNPESSMEPT